MGADRGRREGKTLRGLPESRRHDYTLDLGPQLGTVCRKCGMPKPRYTEDEIECGGIQLVGEQDLRTAREQSIPNYLLSLAWVRQLREPPHIEMDPAFVMASKAAFKAPLAWFGEFRMREQVRIVRSHAIEIYQTIPAEVEAYKHHIACCVFTCKLVNDGNLDPTNQAVLQSVAIIREAESPEAEWNYSLGRCKVMAGDMLKTALNLGYYGGGASSLRPS